MNRILIIFTLAFLVLSCNEQPKEPEADLAVKFGVKNAQTNPIERIGEISFYLCQNGIVKWVKRVDNPTANSIVIPAELNGAGKLYCVANESSSELLPNIVVGDTESHLKSATSSYVSGESENNRVPMSAIVEIPTDNAATSPLNINLTHTMARFDIVAGNANIKPVSIVVSNLPSQGLIFEPDTYVESADVQSFSSTLAAPNSEGVVEGAFFVHRLKERSDIKSIIEITSLYGEQEVKSYIEIKKAEPNKVYRIILREGEGELYGEIVQQGDMESGDISTSDPEVDDSDIFIDTKLSTIPDNVTVDSEGLQITFPYGGSEAIITLNGADKVEYMGQDGSYSDLDVQLLGNGRVKLKTVENHRMTPYSEIVLLKFRKLNSTDYTRVTVTIENYAPVAVVTMLGLDWMVVNAQGESPFYYPHHNNKEPMDIRKIYTNDWHKWAGLGQQWGPRRGNASGYILRLHPITFTTNRGFSNINGGVIGGNATLMWNDNTYCPSGWRPPTKQEIAQIWPPKGTQVLKGDTISYTINEIDYTIRIENFGRCWANGCGEHNNFVISDGTNELMFPISGMRGTQYHFINGAAQPTEWSQTGRHVGTSVFYWCADRQTNGVVSAFGYVGNPIYPRSTAMAYSVTNQLLNDINTFNHDSFCSTRCVRVAQ